MKIGLLITSAFLMVIILISLPLLGAYANIVIYHRSGGEGLLIGLLSAIFIDIVIIISLPFRIRKLK